MISHEAATRRGEARQQHRTRQQRGTGTDWDNGEATVRQRHRTRQRHISLWLWLRHVSLWLWLRLWLRSGDGEVERGRGTATATTTERNQTRSNHPLWCASVIHFVWEKIEEKFIVETTREENKKFDGILCYFELKKMIKFRALLMVAAAGWEREIKYLRQQQLLATLQRLFS
jgi:hypothetical protein